MSTDLPAQWVQRFEQIVGPSGMITDATALKPHLTEWRGLYAGRASVLLRPSAVDQVAAILAFCNENRIGVVPQGGNTGLVGGAIAHSRPEAPEIILSSQRLNRIRNIDTRNYTITAEAGCILANIHEAATGVQRLFPLSLAAEGSCHLGGNISTNAGGTNVLRYGNTRDLVLGLEVVLPDGRILGGLRGLRKDNTGYDLKQLFIGGEGTLGFITAATCKLFPLPRGVATAFIAVSDVAASIELFSRAREALGDQMNAFELLNRVSLELVLTHIGNARHPLSRDSDWFILLERSGGSLDEFLAAQLDSGLIEDATIAQSEDQRHSFWRIRHSISEAQKLEGAGIKHDISVPVSAVAEFIDEGRALVEQLVPGSLVVAFGHLGDGNIHFNLNQPSAMDAEEFLGCWSTVNRAVHELAVSMGGSFSAEHGVGALKSGELLRLSDATDIDLMRALKQALDPMGIMNPGKLLGSREP